MLSRGRSGSGYQQLGTGLMFALFCRILLKFILFHHIVIQLTDMEEQTRV